jgi:hypothetical protein
MVDTSWMVICSTGQTKENAAALHHELDNQTDETATANDSESTGQPTPVDLSGVPAPTKKPAPDTAGEPSDDAPDRHGFTMILTLGLGYQTLASDYGHRSEVGLGGLNIGLGGFLTPNLALMFRLSGTNVDYDGVRCVSGTGGIAVQYWVSDYLNLEGGVGMGIGVLDDGLSEGSDSGLGLIAAIGVPFWHSTGHSLQVGLEFAPVFLDEVQIYNVGINFGWQLL